MTKWFWPAAAIALMALAGCAHKKGASATFEDLPVASLAGSTNAPARDPKLIITLGDGLAGKVASANANLRFVVLTFPIGQMPKVNQRLEVYRRGLKVAELNVTGPQRDDSIVADVVTGDAMTGDEVRDR